MTPAACGRFYFSSMKNRFTLSYSLCMAVAAVSPFANAQDIAQSAPTGWLMNVHFSEESVGQGLPVLALDRPDWADHVSGQPTQARAFRSLKAELGATHPTGWRIAAQARAEAWLQASPDAVTLAALDAKGADPTVVRRYSLNAQSQSWQGEGLMVGTPWWKLDTAGLWQWQADASLLQLRQFRSAELAGDLQYQGGGIYDFNLRSQRANTGITDAFLPASGTSGLGASLSLALEGRPAPGWHLQLRADDLASMLQWANLATDTNALNSQVTSRAADGSLEYAPLLKGQKALRPATGQIGAYWQARVAWSVFESSGQPGALTLRATRKAGMNQSWLGWDSGETGRIRPCWSLELEPSWQAAKLALAWGGWQISAASDGKGLASKYRRLSIGWTNAF
jgi:hypothetical protein